MQLDGVETLETDQGAYRELDELKRDVKALERQVGTLTQMAAAQSLVVAKCRRLEARRYNHDAAFLGERLEGPNVLPRIDGDAVHGHQDWSVVAERARNVEVKTQRRIAFQRSAHDLTPLGSLRFVAGHYSVTR